MTACICSTFSGILLEGLLENGLLSAASLPILNCLYQSFSQWIIPESLLQMVSVDECTNFKQNSVLICYGYNENTIQNLSGVSQLINPAQEHLFRFQQKHLLWLDQCSSNDSQDIQNGWYFFWVDYLSNYHEWEKALIVG